MDDLELEDLDDLKESDYLTSGEEASNDDNLFEMMCNTDMLGREMPPKKKTKVDEEAKKAKDVAKLLRAVCTIRKADELIIIINNNNDIFIALQ